MKWKKITGNDPRPYWNPYLVGVGIGIVIIASFFITGRGLGAIGAFSAMTASFMDAIAPEHAAGNSVFAGYIAGIEHPLKDWVVFEIAGVCIGGLISGLLSRRFRFEVNKGPGITGMSRIILAFTGGVLMAYAAKIARGCTSGLALSGGSTLSIGAWLFMLSVFIGGYSVAFIFKKVWN